MCNHVFVPVAHITEALVTNFALKRLGPRMHPHVSTEVTGQHFFTTQWTRLQSIPLQSSIYKYK